MKKQDLIETLLTYYEDYLSVLTCEELERLIYEAENNLISI